MSIKGPIKGKKLSISKETLRALTRAQLVAAGGGGMVRDFDWKSVDEMEATHRRITAPVLLLWGKDDPWFPLKRARGMLGQFAGGAQLIELPGKVFAHEEHPEAFADHARAFLLRATERTASQAVV